MAHWQLYTCAKNKKQKNISPLQGLDPLRIHEWRYRRNFHQAKSFSQPYDPHCYLFICLFFQDV